MLFEICTLGTTILKKTKKTQIDWPENQTNLLESQQKSSTEFAFLQFWAPLSIHNNICVTNNNHILLQSFEGNNQPML